MTLLGLFLILIVIGVGLYLVAKIPMDPAIVSVIRVVAIVAAVFLVFHFFGVFTGDHRLK